MKTAVYENLRYRIITQELRPGEQLNERKLMDTYEIGRTPLREILIELHRDGLIRRFPRSGTFVAQLDFHFFKEVIEIRINLESFAAQLAATRITSQQIQRLKKILQRVDALQASDDVNLEALTQCEFEFHDTLYEATQNQKLVGILNELHGISARFWHYLVFGQQELKDQFIDLRKVYHAMFERDPESARSAMETHIQNFVEKVRDMIV
ncbi:MAG: GntR family transcriptional regulator [Desulfobacterales bacterium]|nr:GntR family transcriptional regulator [Desulfobacterales bacterium]